eukprot:scaffold22228_cov78-Amphora_coffeaeformis.AAC.2
MNVERIQIEANMMFLNYNHVESEFPFVIDPDYQLLNESAPSTHMYPGHERGDIQEMNRATKASVPA